MRIPSSRAKRTELDETNVAGVRVEPTEWAHDSKMISSNVRSAAREIRATVGIVYHCEIARTAIKVYVHNC